MTRPRYRKEHIVTSVVAVIIDEQERVLLTRRSIPPFKGMWVMPGGKIDLGEPIATALRREVDEEVGLEIEVGSLINVFEHVTPGEENCHYIILFYRCRPVHYDLSHNLDEVSEAIWVARGDLAQYDMPEGTRSILGTVFPEFAA
ncbi:NUDIX domain-containing protein [Trichlorobacter lovleyi]|uniref:NUDIX hydrolase n=1 Tax=Trichlorobacter lovleyi (strain ATCC BAA-1151 / DSM 17278 / SZ) TaxID=398767 RepID=B3E9X8_TRIL1|nr:NUDIX domain-containing protein [Trichlorobacter lovleyi]ACD96853.1 NUDIX hydrolase [Trichlorobacter lovleyi SZ]